MRACLQAAFPWMGWLAATGIVIGILLVWIIQPELGLLATVLAGAGLGLAGVAVGALFTCLIKCL
jgi:hypothetical protein